MNAIERFCEICADEGISAALISDVGKNEGLAALGQACRWNAEKAQRQGEQDRATRLRSAAQYLDYLALPYD